MSRVRNFVFTINHWTEKDVENVKKLEASYLIFAKEIGEGGTPHLQGYCELTKQQTFGAVKKIIPNAHIEARKGTAIQARDYCKKSSTPTEDIYEKGELSQQGTRRDLIEVYRAAAAGSSMKMFMQEHHPNFQELRVFEMARYAFQPKRDFIPYVEWIWGPTGTGKTRSVILKEMPHLWISNKNLRWWGTYENEPAVLIDDFRADFCTFHELLRILDSTPYDVEVKGGFRTLNSARMYFTSCYPPHEVYQTREDIAQLLRRITKITHSSQLTTDCSEVTTQKSGVILTPTFE